MNLGNQDMVKIEQRLLNRIGKREWGLPTLRVPGQIWWSEATNMIYCMTEASETRVSVESLSLQIVGVGEPTEMPSRWREALWSYCQAWPTSGCKYGPFLAIDDATRNRFLRQLGEKLVRSDEVGCQSIAHMIGEFSSYEYEKCQTER